MYLLDEVRRKVEAEVAMHNICVTFSSSHAASPQISLLVHIRGFCYKQGFRNFCYRLTSSVQTEQGFLRLTIRVSEQVFRPLSETFFSPLFSEPSHLCPVQKRTGFLHIWPLSLPSRTSIFTPSGQFFSLRHICKNVK